MDFFVILSDIVVLGSVAIDRKLGDFLEVVEAVTETEKVLHLHFFFEFDKCVVKLRQLLSLVFLRDVHFFYSAGIFQLPISSWVNFD